MPNHNFLSIFQPELLPVEELIQIIESRCCRIQNLRLMGKEGLVTLFRRVVLPLPQRVYRTNRRGQMLTARRARAGLEEKGKKEGSSCHQEADTRLKPPPQSADPVMTTGRRSWPGDGGTDAGAGRKEAAAPRSHSPSQRKIALKRLPSDAENPPTPPPTPTENKRRRTAIKWP